MNKEELTDLISNHFPNLYTDWPPTPPSLQSIPLSARFTNNNNNKKLWKSLHLNLEVKLELSFQKALNVKSFKSLHVPKWTKITNSALVNFDMETYTTYKDTFTNNRRAAIARTLKASPKY